MSDDRIIDGGAQSVTIDAEGLVRVDGFTVFRRIKIEGEVYLEFCDRNRSRSRWRGCRLVVIPLDDLLAKLIKGIS